MGKGVKILLVMVSLAVVLSIAGVASAKTYDYSDTPLLHEAYEGYDDQIPAKSLPDFEIEMDAAEYTDISASNDSRAEFSEVDEYEFHRFVFKIDADVSDISQIYVLHEGYGTKPGGPGHSLYIWNYANPGWEFVDQTSVETPDQILTGTLTDDLSNYVQNGELQLLAITNSESSCPFLYTWNGIGYQFIADINSNGGFGFADPTTKERAVQQPYSEDYTKIDGSQMIPQNGIYRLEVAEEQNEITYMDAVRLLAVDHSPGVEIYSPITNWVNDVPPFQIHTIKDPVVPVSATDGNGVDILPVISEVDRECTEAQPFYFDTITVDFGDLSGAKQIKMLYSAWVDWPGGPESAARYEYISSHPGERYAYMSYVEVINEDGEWERVSDEEHLGRPQAKPRTMVLDITDWFITDDYRIRINNWLDTHIDYIAVDISEDEEVSVVELDPVSADLYWKGVSIQTSPDQKEPTIPDYYDVADITGFSLYEGQFTRYGDVLPLLDEVDDKYVIMHVGDSISIDFDELSIPDGMERDYYLFSDGYYKENFVKWLLGQDVSSVEPLPFHGMSNYPYTEEESYPYDAEHTAYLQEYNTREFRASSHESEHHTIYTDYVKVEITTPVESDLAFLPPTIDGVFSPGEWTGPQLLIDSPIPTNVYFSNDDAFLYVCVDAADEAGGDYSQDDLDYCDLFFDTGHDEAWTPGHEDLFRIYGVGTKEHMVASATPAVWDYDCDFGAHPGLEGAAGFGGSPNTGTDHRIYEYKIPLGLLGASPGDTIGFSSPTREPVEPNSLPHDYSRPVEFSHNVWPPGAMYDDMATWGDLVLASPSTSAVPTISQWGMIGMGILLAAALVWSVRRRWVVSAGKS